ncbi:MAG: FkbM family methyltransferase [Halioglobus sp.]|nr:FkbM family methyltransferase [Halioglobus sp.]
MKLDTPVKLHIPQLAQPLQMYTHGEQDRFVSRRIREESIWEPHETSLILDLLQSGDTFLDVGANIGYFSILAAAAVGEAGHVIAYEPDPENYRLLQANVELNALRSRVISRAAALSDTNGEGRLYLSANNLGDHQVYAGDEERPSVPILLARGDDDLGRTLSRLDLVKVDTQGSEFRVISGLLVLLQKFRPRILLELTPHSLRQAGSSGRELIEMLATVKLPMWIVDHVSGGLHATRAEDLARWCDNWDAVPESQGFMNILVGSAP